MADRPSDIALPEGWTWERVEEQRAKWGIIGDNMVPIAQVAGACVAWGTINSVRMERGGPTADNPNRPYCKPDQSCCDFACGN